MLKRPIELKLHMKFTFNTASVKTKLYNVFCGSEGAFKVCQHNSINVVVKLYSYLFT